MDELAWIRSVRKAREALHCPPERMPRRPSAIRPVVYESWRRSRRQGLEPGRVVPRHHPELEVDGYLPRAAAPVVERRRAALDHAMCALALTDAEGRLLRRWVPDPAFAATLDALAVAPGYSVDESAVGTTSAITLLSGEPVLVRGPEHFSEDFVGLSCAGAPIVHPVTRRILGSLNVTCSLADTSPLVLSWVTDLAAEVQEALSLSASRREQVLLDAYLAHNRDARHPLVVLDQHTIITNAAAARLLGGLDQAMLWEHAAHALAPAGTHPPLITLDGHTVAIECRAVTDGTDPVGAVLMLKPEPARAAARRAAEPAADLPGLVGRGPRWRALCRQAAVAGSGRVLLVGEPGSGRLSVARAMETGGPLRVLDAADATAFGADRWLQEVEVRVDGPDEVLVLRHVDLLVPVLARATDGALRRRGPGRRVLATSTVGAFTSGNPLLDTFDSEIAVPALRERLEDLPALLAALTARAVGDGPSVRWMPDAVQALSRVEWSGNLTSLDAVVRRLVSRRTGGYLGAADLPAELVARASRRQLARLEQAEAQTIMHALRDAGGNKHRAAESLGIARSTLYRKVRALGLDLSTATF